MEPGRQDGHHHQRQARLDSPPRRSPGRGRRRRSCRRLPDIRSVGSRHCRARRRTSGGRAGGGPHQLGRRRRNGRLGAGLARPRGHPGQQREGRVRQALRRRDRRGVGRRNRLQPQVDVPLLPRGRQADARTGRRPHREHRHRGWRSAACGTPPLPAPAREPSGSSPPPSGSNGRGATCASTASAQAG